MAGGLSAARAALERASDHLLALQAPAGYWKGELETNVTMDAEDLLLREFLGIRTAELTAESARWIRSQQRSDGSWANFYEGPADLSTTLEAYVALRLAGDNPSQPHMAKAAAFVREAGGLEKARVFTRLWMALFGLWPWDALPALPPEVVFLPSWFPLNIYDFACWARQTIVALTVVAAHRPVQPLGFGIEELRSGQLPPAAKPWRTAEGAMQRLDRVLHRWERLARAPFFRSTVRYRALAEAERWIVERQEADGGWGGIQPPWVYSLIALNVRGHGVDHPLVAKGLAGLDGFTIREGGLRRLEACQSPVWDTALALVALGDAGKDVSDEQIERAVKWLSAEEIVVRGDWAVKRPLLEPGGWAFEFANDNYPDVDDSAEIVLALRKVGVIPGNFDAAAATMSPASAALERGRRWVGGMVCSDGGWGAFDADNTRELCRRLPFCDFGAVIDPPSADVTAHVVEMLARELKIAGGLSTAERAATESLVRGGIAWLTAAQEVDGSWFGRWGANYVYGTGAVIPALVDAGVDQGDPRVRRAVSWLEAHQSEDGGFGEDLRSYSDKTWSGRGASTASQTAWALLALIAAGEASNECATRAVAWLSETQRADGTWDEPWFTGTGFPGDFYINYHLYRLVFPISALGRYVAALDGHSLSHDTPARDEQTVGL
ncbi:MAG: squalene--hopene cyclase [Acidimicrobiales bacterium]